MSVTGKASSFALTIHRLIDGILCCFEAPLKAKTFIAVLMISLVTMLFKLLNFLVHDFDLKPWELSVLLCRLSSAGQKEPVIGLQPRRNSSRSELE